MSNVITLTAPALVVELGDCIEYRDQASKQLRRATVMDTAGCAPGWITISDDGAKPEDDADIQMSCVTRVIEWSQPIMPELLAKLEMDELLFLAQQLVQFRKDKEAA
jgi:hypothetical protein